MGTDIGYCDENGSDIEEQTNLAESEILALRARVGRMARGIKTHKHVSEHVCTGVDSYAQSNSEFLVELLTRPAFGRSEYSFPDQRCGAKDVEKTPFDSTTPRTVSNSLRILKAKAAQQSSSHHNLRNHNRFAIHQEEKLPRVASDPLEMWSIAQNGAKALPRDSQDMFHDRYVEQGPLQERAIGGSSRGNKQASPAKMAVVSPETTTSSRMSAHPRPSSREWPISVDDDGATAIIPHASCGSASSSNSGTSNHCRSQESATAKTSMPNRKAVESCHEVDIAQCRERRWCASNERQVIDLCTDVGGTPFQRHSAAIETASDSGWSSFDVSPRADLEANLISARPDKRLSEHVAETRAWETHAEAQLALLKSQNEEQAERVSSLVATLRTFESKSAEQAEALSEANTQRRASLYSLSQLEAIQAKAPASRNEVGQLERVPEVENSQCYDCYALRQYAEQLARELAASDAARTAALRDAQEFKQHAEQLVIEHTTAVSDEIQDLGTLRQRTEQLRHELAASDAERIAAQLDAQRARLASEELGERFKVAQVLSQRLQSEHEDAQGEISSLSRIRHQLEAQLDGCEMARESLERQLLAQQAHLHDSQTRCGETSSGLRQAQFQGEAMKKELRQAHAHAEQNDALANAQYHLKAELLQCQNELHDAHKANQQGSICVNQLRQENERMLADSRAASVLTDSLRRELRDASDRATSQHADNCDLRISLETSRLEIERLRDTLATSQRENIMLQRRLHQRLTPGAGGSKLGSANDLSGPLRRASDSCGNSSSGADEVPPQSAVRDHPLALQRSGSGQPEGNLAHIPLSTPSSPGINARQPRESSGPADTARGSRRVQTQPSESGVAPDSVARVLHHGQNAREQELEREKQVGSIEKQLMVLNAEKKQLENNMMKFPSNGAGRTLAHRRQKREIEQRIEEVDRTLNELRQRLRQIEGRC